MLTLALLACIGIVGLWTPFLNPQFLSRWFAWPGILYAAPVPLLTLAIAAKLVIAVNDRREVTPFVATLGLFVLCYIGLGISLYPNIVPPSVTIWDAAGPDTSLRFLLIGSVVLLPIILAYTACSYWVFRGKVDTEGGCH